MRKTLKAASIVEALVASVIFLTVFLIAMSSLVNIARIRASRPSPVDIEDAVAECIAKFKDESDNASSYDFEWGAVQLNAKPYGTFDGVMDVTVLAKVKYGRTVIYKYIIQRDEDYTE